MDTTTMIIAGALAAIILISLGLVVLTYAGRTWPLIGPALEPLYQSLEEFRRTFTEAANNVLRALYNFFVLPFVEVGNTIVGWFNGLRQTLARGWGIFAEEKYWWVPVLFVIAFPILIIYVIWSYRRSIKVALRG